VNSKNWSLTAAVLAVPEADTWTQLAAALACWRDKWIAALRLKSPALAALVPARRYMNVTTRTACEFFSATDGCYKNAINL